MGYRKFTPPTCQKCGRGHYNFTRCQDTEKVERDVRRLTGQTQGAAWVENKTEGMFRPFNQSGAGTLVFSTSPMKERGSVIEYTGVSNAGSD